MSARSIGASVFALMVISSPALAGTLLVPTDHKTIQSAIDAAKPGDTVLVQPGIYRESIRLRDRITLKSAGDDARGPLGLKRAETTIIDGGGTAARGPAVRMAEGAVLDGFTITRVGEFDQKEYDRHHAERGENLPDERGAVGAAENFPALAVEGVTAVVQNNIVCANGHAGIGCTGGKGKRNASVIAKNVCYRNMGGGIGVADGATPTIEENRCYQNLRGGIGNRNSAAVILSNDCFDNVRAGIGIREGAKPLVRGNKCYRNRRAGIGCRMKGTTPLIEDNDCYQNGMAGIGCRDGASPVIRKNRCYENERAGIGLRADAEALIEGNHVHHNKAAGIGFEECKAGKATVLNNKVIDNGEVAIGLHAGWKVRILGNELTRKDGLPPIVMVFKGAEADFSDNTITGSGVAGIRTQGVVRITKNHFACPTQRKGGGPPQFAVWGLPGAEIVFTGNTVQGWRHALVAEKAAISVIDNKVSGYWQVGVRITQPTVMAVVRGNVFLSESAHAGVAITGGEAIVENNRVEKPVK